MCTLHSGTIISMSTLIAYTLYKQNSRTNMLIIPLPLPLAISIQNYSYTVFCEDEIVVINFRDYLLTCRSRRGVPGIVTIIHIQYTYIIKCLWCNILYRFINNEIFYRNIIYNINAFGTHVNSSFLTTSRTDRDVNY